MVITHDQQNMTARCNAYAEVTVTGLQPSSSENWSTHRWALMATFTSLLEAVS